MSDGPKFAGDSEQMHGVAGCLQPRLVPLLRAVPDAPQCRLGGHPRRTSTGCRGCWPMRWRWLRCTDGVRNGWYGLDSLPHIRISVVVSTQLVPLEEGNRHNVTMIAKARVADWLQRGFGEEGRQGCRTLLECAGQGVQDRRAQAHPTRCAFTRVRCPAG